MQILGLTWNSSLQPLAMFSIATAILEMEKARIPELPQEREMLLRVP